MTLTKCLKFRPTQIWHFDRPECHVFFLFPIFADKNSSTGSKHNEGGRLLKSSPPPKPKKISLDQTEVFATVLYTEFLKELAAIAQEHSVLSCIPMEEQ